MKKGYKKLIYLYSKSNMISRKFPILICSKKPNQLNIKDLDKTKKLNGKWCAKLKKGSKLKNDLYYLNPQFDDLDNAKSIIIIGRDKLHLDNEKDIMRIIQEYNLVTLDVFNIIANDNINTYEYMISTRNNVFYKLPIDIDYYLDSSILNEKEINLYKSNNMIDVIHSFVSDMITFINKYIILTDQKIKVEDVLIATSCGYKKSMTYKISYHIIFPIIFKWKYINELYKLCEENVFMKYNMKYGKNFIDGSVAKSTKAFRVINSSKKEIVNDELVFSDLVKKPLYQSNVLYSDYLVGVYSTEDEDRYYKISDDFFTKVNDIIINTDFKTSTFKPDYNIYYNHYLICIIQSIHNDIEYIDRKKWLHIISNVALILKKITKEAFDEQNSLKNPIKYEERQATFIKVLTKWTDDCYKSYNPFKNKSLIELKTEAKNRNISGYNSKSKTELIDALYTRKYKKPPTTKHHKTEITKIFDYIENVTNDTTINNIQYKLLYIARCYNKSVTNEWNIINIVPKLEVNLKDYDDFLKIIEFPEYGEPLDSIFEKHKNIYIQAIMGLGKTEQILRIISKYPRASILIISPRISYAESMKKRYNDYLRETEINPNLFELYKVNNKFVMGSLTCDRLVISMEALWKIKQPYDIVILDELDANVNSSNGATCEHYKNEIYKKLIEFSSSDTFKHFIFAEALPSLSSMLFMKNIVNVKIQNKPYKSNKCLTYTTEKHRFKQRYNLIAFNKTYDSTNIRNIFIYDIIRDINNGLNIVAVINMRKFIQMDIKKILDDNKIRNVIITADTKTEYMKYIINPSLLVTDKIQFFGATLTITVGWSVEIQNYWHKKFMFYEGYGQLNVSIRVNDFLQALHRFRYIQLIDEHQITDVYLSYNQDYTNNRLISKVAIEKQDKKQARIESTLNDIEYIQEIEEMNDKIHITNKYDKTAYINKYNDIDEPETNKTKPLNKRDILKHINRFDNFEEDGEQIKVTQIFDKTEYNRCIEQDRIVTEIRQSCKFIDNVSRLYFLDIFKQKVINQGNIFNDENTITKNKELENVEQNYIIKDDKNTKTTPFEEVYDNIQQQISNNDKTDASYYKLLDMKAKDGNFIYNIDEKIDIEKIYICETYFYGDSYNIPDMMETFVLVSLCYENYKIILYNLIIYYHKQNHIINTNYKLEFNIDLITFLTKTFNLNEFNQYDKIEINGKTIIENQYIINDYYQKYIVWFELKGKRFDDKINSKLKYLIKEMFHLEMVAPNQQRKSYLFNGIKERYYNYILMGNEFINKLYKSFDYNKRNCRNIVTFEEIDYTKTNFCHFNENDEEELYVSSYKKDIDDYENEDDNINYLQVNFNYIEDIDDYEFDDYYEFDDEYMMN